MCYIKKNLSFSSMRVKNTFDIVKIFTYCAQHVIKRHCSHNNTYKTELYCYYHIDIIITCYLTYTIFIRQLVSLTYC